VEKSGYGWGKVEERRGEERERKGEGIRETSRRMHKICTNASSNAQTELGCFAIVVLAKTM